jgi:hypothetical protein
MMMRSTEPQGGGESVQKENVSAVRQARAQVVHGELLGFHNHQASLTLLQNSLCYPGSGWSRRLVDQAVDDLVAGGSATLDVSRHPAIMVRAVVAS